MAAPDDPTDLPSRSWWRILKRTFHEFQEDNLTDWAASLTYYGVMSLFTMLVAIYYLPGEPWPKAFLALGTVFLTTASFSLAKCVRDAQESQYMVSRLDRARVEQILADHNPWKEVG